MYNFISAIFDSWFASKDHQFFQRAIRTLPEIWGKVVASGGQYFELQM